jgi:hypothetical protein
MVKSQIRWLLNEYFEAMNATIDSDGYVNVIGSCILHRVTTALPVKFRRVGGNFVCSRNSLTSLQGSPSSVGGDFLCTHNNLTSLQGMAQTIDLVFRCSNNPLESLDGLSESFRGRIYLDYNSDMPILKLLRCEAIYFSLLDPIHGLVEDILNKYCGDKFSRSNILKCQKELIQNGFESNASW